MSVLTCCRSGHIRDQSLQRAIGPLRQCLDDLAKEHELGRMSLECPLLSPLFSHLLLQVCLLITLLRCYSSVSLTPNMVMQLDLNKMLWPRNAHVEQSLSSVIQRLNSRDSHISAAALLWLSSNLVFQLFFWYNVMDCNIITFYGNYQAPLV